ncbi:hypothetical protein protein [Babesia ovis]|uniref:Uncharacterized protein n=1 Tax=Babesia ovis TaxID=5869 RepID=A0A9W5WTQ6_BABOV|nr:hypothetical protein protein [Babesia ovis]
MEGLDLNSIDLSMNTHGTYKSRLQKIGEFFMNYAALLCLLDCIVLPILIGLFGILDIFKGFDALAGPFHVSAVLHQQLALEQLLGLAGSERLYVSVLLGIVREFHQELRDLTDHAFNHLGVHHDGAHENTDDTQELEETHTNQGVGEKVLLNRWVACSSRDQGGEKVTNTLSDTSDGHQGNSCSKSGDSTVIPGTELVVEWRKAVHASL